MSRLAEPAVRAPDAPPRVRATTTDARRWKRELLLLLVVALAVRVALLGAFAPWDPDVEASIVLQSDPLGYHVLGLNIARLGSFIDPQAARPDVSNSCAFRPPLYPLYLGAVYLVAGPRPWVALLGQLAAELLTCALVYLLVARWIGRRAAWWAALLFAVDPMAVVFFAVMSPDTFLLSMSVVAAGLLIAGLHEERAARAAAWMAAAGVAVGLATLLKPVGQLLPWAMLPALVAVWWRRPGLLVGGFALLFVAFQLTILPWTLRNEAIYGARALSTSGAWNLMVTQVAPFEAARRGLSQREAGIALAAEAEALMRADGHDPAGLNDFEKTPYWSRIAREAIREHPLLFARHFALGIAHTFANLSSRGTAIMLGLEASARPVDVHTAGSVGAAVESFARRKSTGELAIALVVGVLLAISYAATAVGLMVGWRRDTWRALLVVLLLFGYFVAVHGAVGSARYKLPAIPFYLMFGGVGLAWLEARLRGGARDNLASAGTGGEDGAT